MLYPAADNRRGQDRLEDVRGTLARAERQLERTTR